MRLLAFAFLLATAAVLGIGGWQMVGGKEGGVQQLVGLGMLGMAVGAAGLGVLVLVRDRSKNDYDDTFFSFLPPRMQERLAVLSMVAFAVLIVGMLLKGLIHGSIPRMVGSGRTHLRESPAGFFVQFGMWASLAWALGWFLPRQISARDEMDDQD